MNAENPKKSEADTDGEAWKRTMVMERALEWGAAIIDRRRLEDGLAQATRSIVESAIVNAEALARAVGREKKARDAYMQLDRP